MIKICFVIDTIESPSAGTENQLLLLIKNLDRKKFQIHLCVLRSSEWLRTHFDLCQLNEIGISSFRTLSAWVAVFRFAKFLRTEKVDIVQTYFRDSSIAGILAAKFAGINTIIGSRRNQGYWMNPMELLIQKFLNRSTTLFVANSESTRQWAAKIEGIDLQRIHVIYNGIRAEQFHRGSESQRASFRKLLGFPDHAVIIGIIANLRPVKAIDVFIKAAKIVTERLPQARFIVVGQGTERGALEALCSDLELQPFMRFLGARFDVPGILSCIDIGVLSSNSESFSNSVVEYMTAGLAVVCTDVGGAREAVEDGVNGYVIKPGDSGEMADRLNTIIVKNLYGGMGQYGREKALRMFSHEDIVWRYQQLYKDMV